VASIGRDRHYRLWDRWVLSQKLEDEKLHRVSNISSKLSPTELNYDIFDKELLAIVFSLKKWMPFLQGAEHKMIVYYNPQNLSYFKTAISLNRSQARFLFDNIGQN